MELSLIPDTLTTIASTHAGLSLGFPKLLNSSSDQPAGPLQISAAMVPLDAVAPPPVQSNRVRTLPRRLLKKRRRTRKRSLTGDDGNGDGEEVFGCFGDSGDSDGPFNNGNTGGGGRGGNWNFGGFGGSYWDDFFSNNNDNSYHDPAFDFVSEVLSWIVLSNCLHFAFNKVVRIVADGFSDPSREKVPMRLESVC